MIQNLKIMRQNLIIINKETIQKRIKDLRFQRNREPDNNMQSYLDGRIKELKAILLNSIPLKSELEKAFTSSREFNSQDGIVDIDIVVGFHQETKDLQGVFINSENYISQLKLEI